MKRICSLIFAILLLGSLSAFAYEGDWALQAIHAEAAQQYGLDGTGVRIAVIDSGVNLDDLNLSHVTRLSLRDDDGADQYGHGTIVSGIIAGVHDNDVGVNGLSPGVELISIKVFVGNESVSFSLLAKAVDTALSYECDIINLSLSASVNNETLQNAVHRAVQQGVIVVAASGNDGNMQAHYPGAYPFVAGVGAVGLGNQVSVFSQRNPEGAQYTWLVAPGESVYGGTYLSVIDSGSSFSCAFVSAAAALARQMDPSLTPDCFLTLLAHSAEDLGPGGFDAEYGYGLLRIDRMLSLLKHRLEPAPFPDIGETWYEDTVLQLKDFPLFQGRDNGYFDGGASITRAEFAALMVRTLGLSETDGTGAVFADVPAAAWFCGAVETAAQVGIVNGRGNGAFAPFDSITRQEAMAMLRRAAKLVPFSGAAGDLTAFTDENQVSDWAKEPVGWNIGSRIVIGSGGLLRPLDPVSRAETAAMLLRLLQQAGIAP